jgi:hypothetical protein
MTMKVTKIRFDSIEQLVRDNERWGKDPTDGRSSRHTGMDEWCGTSSYEAAVDLVSKGWPEGAKSVSKVRATLDRAVESLVSAKAQELAYGVEGEWLDIGRLNEGHPECCGYYDYDGEDEKQKIVKIVANICVSACVSTDTMYARGAACIAAVDVLESMGYRVELWAGVGTDSGNERLDSQVLVKDAGQPVDTDRLTYVLCHPAFFRRIYFAHMELNRMNPCGCFPSGVEAENAVVLPELCSSSRLGKADIVREVAKICELAGVSFDAKEVMSAAKA